jgi:uncharacterized protein (TIGR02145 family)
VQYQWQRGTSDIKDEISATYKLASAAMADNNVTFRCVVSNSAGKDTSNSATLTVSNKIIPAEISTDPVNASVVEGSSATFSVTANGTGVQYQWQRGMTDIKDEISATCKLSSAAMADNNVTFRCVVSNGAGKDTSNSATLTVSNKIIPAEIATDPVNASVVEGSSATFSVTANGTGVQYQWQRGTSDIKDEISATCKLASAAMADNNVTFRCVVSNGAGKDTSNSATLTVLPKPAAPVISTVTPGDANVIVSWGAVSGAASYTLYYKEGTTVDTTVTTKVSGAALTQTVTGLKNGTVHAFAVTAVNANGKSSLSEIRTATPQVPVAGAPTLSAPTPGSGKVTLSWTAVTGALSYKVYCQSGTVTAIDTATATKKAVAAVLTTDISSLTNCQVYTFGVSSVNAGGESVIGTLQTGSPVSAVPTITTAPNPTKTACEGTLVEIDVGATPVGNTLIYQWSKDTRVITTAENSTADKATFVIPSAATGDAGTYSCLVKNGCSSTVPSGNCVLTINRKSTAPTAITATPNTICDGGTSVLAVTGTLGTNATWKWYENSNFSTPATVTAVSGITDGSKVNVSSTGTYYAQAEGDCGKFGSTTVSATVSSTQYTVTPTQSTNGTITPTGVATVNCGSTRIYTITPDNGYRVSDVKVNGVSLAPPTNSYTFTDIRAAKTITATYVPITYTLTINSSTGGSVTLSPPGGTYSAGTVVTLTPVPTGNYLFANYTGDPVTSSTITMNSNKTVTANFGAAVTVTYNGNSLDAGSAQAPIPVKVLQGTSINIATAPTGMSKAGCVFSGWSTAKNGLGSPYNVNESKRIDIDITLYANWTVQDASGNEYHTITIGTQTWMVENLRTATLNTGNTPISYVTDGPSWGSLTTPGYCWYNNDESANKATYGALYNAYAVNTGMLAPAGWRVPTDDDWSTLSTFFDGDAAAGGKLKEAGSAHWTSPNTGTNDLGFSALGGGVRNRYSGAFGATDGGYGSGGAIKDVGHWWTSTVSGNTNYFRKIYYDGNAISSDNYWGRGDSPLQCGFSVRCVRN